MIQMLRDLAAHARWADAVAFHALGKCPEAVVDADVLERLHHAAFVAGAFATMIEGGDIPRWSKEPPAFPEIRKITQEAGDRLARWAASATAQALDRQIHVPWFGDPPFRLPAREAFLQAILHTQHHRGQTMTRLKQLGGKTVNVDYILWVWKQRPEPRWPESGEA